MTETAISWTHRPGTRGRTWNPVRGCSRVSDGCRHCYAETQAARIVRMGRGKATAYDGLVKLVGGEPRWTGEVRLVSEHLADPLRWRDPSTVFVNSMSDLFHESLTNEQIAAVFGVMAACPQHTFQVLTKRARRMREWFEWVTRDHYPRPGSGPPGVHVRVSMQNYALAALPTNVFGIPVMSDRRWPLQNVWLGVSVENQAAADERIPELLATPAAVRFLSCEPLLAPVNIESLLWKESPQGYDWPSGEPRPQEFEARKDLWVISGCESGPGARPCDVAWLRSLRDQCSSASVPFFLKQASGTASTTRAVYPSKYAARVDVPSAVAGGDGSRRKAGGVIELPYLDGVQHANFPEVP